MRLVLYHPSYLLHSFPMQWPPHVLPPTPHPKASLSQQHLGWHKDQHWAMHSVRSLQNTMKPISHADMKVQEAKRKKELKQKKVEAQNELYKRVLGKSYAREGGRGHR